jgi:hypothetical protein
LNVTLQDIDVDDDPTPVIEHFSSCFKEHYKNAPAFFVGTLQQALNKAFHVDTVEDVRLHR